MQSFRTLASQDPHGDCRHCHGAKPRVAQTAAWDCYPREISSTASNCAVLALCFALLPGMVVTQHIGCFTESANRTVNHAVIRSRLPSAPPHAPIWGFTKQAHNWRRHKSLSSDPLGELESTCWSLFLFPLIRRVKVNWWDYKYRRTSFASFVFDRVFRKCNTNMPWDGCELTNYHLFNYLDSEFLT